MELSTDLLAVDVGKMSACRLTRSPLLVYGYCNLFLLVCLKNMNNLFVLLVLCSTTKTLDMGNMHSKTKVGHQAQ
jgi:hypothetical protein